MNFKYHLIIHELSHRKEMEIESKVDSAKTCQSTDDKKNKKKKRQRNSLCRVKTTWQISIYTHVTFHQTFR